MQRCLQLCSSRRKENLITDHKGFMYSENVWFFSSLLSIYWKYWWDSVIQLFIVLLSWEKKKSKWKVIFRVLYPYGNWTEEEQETWKLMFSYRKWMCNSKKIFVWGVWCKPFQLLGNFTSKAYWILKDFMYHIGLCLIF